MGKSCFASILLGLVFTFLLPAQVGTEGAFFGTVTDTTGSSVPRATVSVAHLETGFAKQAVTDTEGTFSIFGVPIGKYSVTGFPGACPLYVWQRSVGNSGRARVRSIQHGAFEEFPRR